MPRELLRAWTHPEPELHDEIMRELRERPEAREALADLRRARELGGPFEPRGSGQSWEETLMTSDSDAVAVGNSTTETIMLPDFSIPANYMYYGVGPRTLRYTLWGKISTVITTPGTITHRLRWGGVSGTTLATSGAYAPDPTAASTDLTFLVEWTLVCRSTTLAASTGTMIAFGQRVLQDFDDATVTTIIGNLNMTLMPASSPAAVASLDTTVAKALSPTVQFSVAGAGTTQTVMAAILETLN